VWCNRLNEQRLRLDTLLSARQRNSLLWAGIRHDVEKWRLVGISIRMSVSRKSGWELEGFMKLFECVFLGAFLGGKLCIYLQLFKCKVRSMVIDL
jgi:hypothetical protein